MKHILGIRIKIIKFCYSGATCCSITFDSDSIFVGNCGDSRAVMCSFSQKQGIRIKQLSTDHKPDLEDEK